MTDIFLNIGKMSLQGSLVILVVFAVRFLFDRFNLPKKYINVIWFVPFICLILPWRMESDFSVWQLFEIEVVTEDTDGTFIPGLNTEISDSTGDLDNVHNMDSNNGDKPADITPDKPNTSHDNNNLSDEVQTPEMNMSGNKSDDVNNTIGNEEANSNINKDVEKKEKSSVVSFFKSINITAVYSILCIVWIAGVIGIAVYSVIDYIRLLNKVKVSVHAEGNIYYAEHINVPFTIGIFRPRIYIPSNICKEDAELIIEHEKTHIKRNDPLKKMIIYVITLVHWFNPLVWVAFWFFGKDMEMACDEETVTRLGTEYKKEYATVLLEVAAKKNDCRLNMFPAFGGGDVKERIYNVLKKKRTIGMMSGVIVILVIVMAIIFLTTGKKNEISKKTEKENSQSETTTGETSDENETDEKNTEETTEKPTEEIVNKIDYNSEELAYIIKPGEDNIFHYDMDNDGESEEIIISSVEDNGYLDTTLKIVDEKKVLFESYNLTPGKPEENEWSDYTYFIVRENSKNYLLEYEHYSSGDCGEYKLIEFHNTTSMDELIQAGEASLMLNDYFMDNTSAINSAVTFYNDLTDFMTREDTIVLFDMNYDEKQLICSKDEEIKYSDSRVVKDVFEYTISESNFESLGIKWNENDTLEEKISKYCNYCISSDLFLESFFDLGEERDKAYGQFLPVDEYDYHWEGEGYEYIIKPGESSVLHYDMDNDGEDEVITIYAEVPMYQEEFPITKLKITDGDKVIFETNNFFYGLSCEYISYMYYIVRENGKNYLLQVEETVYQGDNYKTYSLIGFESDGTRKVVKKGSANLSNSPGMIVNNTMDIENALAYYENLMEYLLDEKTILLFDLDWSYDNMVYSSDENIKHAEDRLEENVLGFGFTDEEYNNGKGIDKLRDIVERYCIYWMKYYYNSYVIPDIEAPDII